MIHGIAIRDSDKKLVDFHKVSISSALGALSFIRHNLRRDLVATEDYVSESDLAKIGKEVKVI